MCVFRQPFFSEPTNTHPNTPTPCAAQTPNQTDNRSPEFTLDTPLVVYVPPGDYVITATLPLYFLTHLVGNSLCPPRLVVPPNTMTAPQTFVLSGDTSYNGDHDDEFYRGVRHIDIVFGPGNLGGCGVHWAESQATFLRDMVIDLGADGQYGVFDENGRQVARPSQKKKHQRAP